MVALSNGVATFTTTSLALGSHSLRAAYQGDPNFTGSASTLTEAIYTPNQRFVDRLYPDLLDRAPDAAGMAAWTALLDRGMMSRSEVALGIEHSPEYYGKEVQQLYALLLHRAADPTGLRAFTSLLAAGDTREQVAALIAGSAEYLQNRAGGNNNGFLDALYLDALQRPTDPVGKAGFGSLLAGGMSRDQVAEMIFGSEEYRGYVVQSYYQLSLHRAADPTGLNAFTQAMNQGWRDEDVLAAIFGSPEYFGTL
jgi:hypothetical protein